MSATLDVIEERIRQGQLQQARQSIRGLPDAEHRLDKAYLEGYAREAEHDRAGALAMYEQVLNEQPDHVRATFRAGYVCELCGDDEAALQHYESCVSHTPAPVNAMLNLAQLYEERGMLRDAEALVRAVVDMHPNHFRARQMLESVDSSFTMVVDEQTARDRDKRNAMLDTPITDFELSVRSRNCLRQMNIRTLGDLLRTTEAELLAYKNFGETSLNEIKSLLTQRNLRLGQALQPVEAPAATPAVPAVSSDASIHLRRQVSELELSVRSRKALMRLGVTTMGELISRSEGELLAIKNFGQTSLNEIKRQLATFGLSLRQ